MTFIKQSLTASTLVLGLVSALQAGASTNSSTNVSCQDLNAPAQPAIAAAANPGLVDWGKKIYVNGADPIARPNAYVPIGFESEYTLDEAAMLLRSYAPVEFVNEGRLAQWENMSDQQHLDWLKAKIKGKPEFAESSGFILFAKQPEVQFLPRELVLDSTGNLEIVLPPVTTYQEFESHMDIINARFGTGSMQAMISAPRDLFFKSRTGSQTQSQAKAILGWLNFTNELDTLNKLKRGYDSYLKDPNRPVAMSFQHQWLGPMTQIKSEKLLEYIEANITGAKFDKQSRLFIKQSDSSFKYIGGLAYRPDIGAPDNVGFEQRSAHKNSAMLKEQVKRDILALHNGISNFEDFAEIKPVDTIEDFERFPKAVQTVLAEIFPSKADPRFQYNENELRSLEVYRNFSFPLRDWSVALKLLSPGSLREQSLKVREAQLLYQKRVFDVVELYRTNGADKAQASVKIQAALAHFVFESGLADLYVAKYKQLTAGLQMEVKKAAGQ